MEILNKHSKSQKDKKDLNLLNELIAVIISEGVDFPFFRSNSIKYSRYGIGRKM